MGSIVIQKEKLEKKARISHQAFPSTVLVPTELWKRVPADAKKNFPRYLSRLQIRYGLLLQSRAYLGRNPLRITFQDKGQKLIRHSYRPIEQNYQELKNLSLSHGVSINYLIVLMIIWDDTGLGKKIIERFWKNRKPPLLTQVNFQRILNLKTQQLVLLSYQYPNQFILARGSPEWSPG